MLSSNSDTTVDLDFTGILELGVPL